MADQRRRLRPKPHALEGMNYLKPLRFFKATRNVQSLLAKGSLMSLNVTDKYLSMASTDNSKVKRTAYNDGFMPRNDDTLPNLLCKLQTKMLENGLAGIIIGKKSKGAVVDALVEDLCKMRELRSLKYTFWVMDTSIVSRGSSVLEVESYVRQNLSQDADDQFSAFYVLQGYLDYFNTFLETIPNPEKYFGPYK